MNFESYFPRLFRYLLVVTRGNEELARELLQQTMIKVARHIYLFRDEAAFWRWLTVLARTSAMDEARKRQRYFSFLDRFWNWRRHVLPAEPDHEQVFDTLLKEQLNKLKPDERAIIEQKYIDGQSVHEMAAALHMTEKAIESKLSRLRVKLKTNILQALKNERSLDE
jgi:RNA polymerase sigma-70 factor, ECF subfamily